MTHENTRHTIPMVPGHYGPASLRSNAVLTITGSYHRFGVGMVPEGESARQEFGGPMVPGPWAYTYGPMASVITADPEHSTGAEMRRKAEAGLVFHVEDGDEVEVQGLLYRAEYYGFQRAYLRLVATH